jgi:hypothetical protein
MTGNPEVTQRERVSPRATSPFLDNFRFADESGSKAIDHAVIA